MKSTAWAPANIAFIKYWGKADDELRLPLNASISMNLSGAHTITTVEFSKELKEDKITLLDGTFSDHETLRVMRGLDRIRKRATKNEKAKVVTKNTFPKGAGSAASASGFAALTVAGFSAVGKSLSEKELSIVARQGSGSACRSIPDGFVQWKKGNTSQESFAYSLYPSGHWDLRDALVIVDSSMKKVSTTIGMEAIRTSPLLDGRLAALPERLDRCQKALADKNFLKLGEVVEEDCLDMHEVMQSQVPPLNYWNETTRHIMNMVRLWRKEGALVYFTIDAGPNVHILYQAKDEQEIHDRIQRVEGVESIIVNKPAAGAHSISEHLF